MIVVTTPTGAIGSKVVENLLAAGEDVRVIARDPSHLPADIQDHVEVIEGSHGDAAVVGRAFNGAEQIFWVAPPNPRAESLESVFQDFAAPARDAIRAYGVKRVVSVSALGRGTSVADRAGLVTASLEMDDLFAGTGADFRALTMPSFMDNMLRQADSIRAQGVFRNSLAPGRKLPTCATRDIAGVATTALLDTTWTGRAELPVLGPEDLSQDDMAEIISRVVGKPVRYERVSIDAVKAQYRSFGMSDAFINGYADMMTAKDQGLDNAAQRTPDSTTPTTFRAWCEEVFVPALAG